MSAAHLVLADIREVPTAYLELHRRFDLATAHFNFPHLFSRQELVSALSGVAACLRPDGYFLFDFTPLPPTPPEPVDEFVDAGGQQLRLNGKFDDSLGCYVQHWSCQDLDTVEHYWFHGANEMREAIASAGMNLKCVLGWHPENHAAPWESPSGTSHRAMYVCHRLLQS
jgi:SAM-dependent methyltransferase